MASLEAIFSPLESLEANFEQQGWDQVSIESDFEA